MLDYGEQPRWASQPLVLSPRSSQDPLSTFLHADLKAWHPRTKRAASEALPRSKGQSGSNIHSTKHISADSREDGDRKERLSTPNEHENGETNEKNQTGNESTGNALLYFWKRFVPHAKYQVNHVTVMYSISFYPWKMEPHCYYSHPEAAANWMPDTSSPRCQICLVSFTLTRRRHHCRLCGHLVCANCSPDRTYLPFLGSAPSQHRLIKDGAPQRTCSACASTLQNMAGQDDPRVKRFTVAVPSRGRRKSTVSSNASIEVEVERPSLLLRQPTSTDVEDEAFYAESTKALQLERQACGNALHYPLRLSVTRAEELDEILSARTCSRLKVAVSSEEKLDTRQFVMSSAWLKQWLQYVRVDTTTSDALMANMRPSGERNRRGTRQSRKNRIVRPRRPGPVSNYELLRFVGGELVARDGLQQSRGNHKGGDYRVVSQEVWLSFLEIYGGGPSIQVQCNGQSRGTEPQVSSIRPQWIITELDDSIPALATSLTDNDYASNSRQRGGRMRFLPSEVKTYRNHSPYSMVRTRSEPTSCLISAPFVSLAENRTTLV